MFRPMRRDKKAMAPSHVDALIKNGEYGELAVLDTNGYPYAVPVNYVSDDTHIYIHCATEGSKLDAIAAYEKVSFTIVGRHAIVAKRFSSDFESVVCFGKARLIDNTEEKIELLKKFIYKYSPDFEVGGLKYVGTDYMKTSMIAIEIEHKTGKTNLEEA